MAKKKRRSIGATLRMILGTKKNPLATVTIHGKSKKQVAAKAARFRTKHMKNIDAFWRDGVRHPIRASKGYSRQKAGERQYARLRKHYGGRTQRMR
ncbi:MAG: hypothetical protein WB780_20370 [Candidatus Acidiferrales bacterium]